MTYRIIQQRFPTPDLTEQHICHRPGWWERHQEGLVEGAIIQCNDCERKWRFVNSGGVWELIEDPKGHSPLGSLA